MIESRSDYVEYVRSDKRSLQYSGTLREWLTNDVARFQRSLRRLEYLQNCRKPLPWKLLAKWHFRRVSRQLGFSIPPNTFGPGLAIPHFGTIVVNHAARIGANCRIHVGVNIGNMAGESSAAPSIGNECYIGPGAKIFGPIRIGDRVAIGANSVVNRDVPDGVTVAGVPARIVAERSSSGYLIAGYVDSAADRD